MALIHVSLYLATILGGGWVHSVHYVILIQRMIKSSAVSRNVHQ
jgi:hypothetical protein